MLIVYGTRFIFNTRFISCINELGTFVDVCNGSNTPWNTFIGFACATLSCMAAVAADVAFVLLLLLLLLDIGLFKRGGLDGGGFGLVVP